MKMKPLLFCIVWLFTLAEVYSSKNAANVVVLMDMSGTILPYYDAINNRVLHSIISTFIKKGDSFHLLSFSAESRYEMSCTINTEADLSRVVSRFMLLYPLGQSADFLAGLYFASEYMDTLPQNEETVLIIISDGIFNPPATSPYKAYTGEKIKTELAKIAADIRNKGRRVYYVKLPFPKDAVMKDLDGDFFAGSGVTAGNSFSGIAMQNRNLADNTMQQGGTIKVGSTGSAKQKSQQRYQAGNLFEIDNSTHPANSSITQGYLQADIDTVAAENKLHNAGSGVTAGNSFSGIAMQNRSLADNTPATKTYIDVSDAFTKDMGIQLSALPPQGSVVFHKAAQSLPVIDFPQTIHLSENTVRLPVSVKNMSDVALNMIISGATVVANNTAVPLAMTDISVMLGPKQTVKPVITAALPFVFSAGSHTVDIRLDCKISNTLFAHAGTVLLIVPPLLAGANFPYSAPGIEVAAVFLALCVVLLVILFKRHRISVSVQKKLQYPLGTPVPRISGGQTEQSVFSHTVHTVVRTTAAAAAPITWYKQAAQKTETALQIEQTLAKSRVPYRLNSADAEIKTILLDKRQAATFHIDCLAQEHTKMQNRRLALLNATVRQMNRYQGFISPLGGNTVFDIQSTHSGVTELFVVQQNKSIGKRNIHEMKKNKVLTIGGSKSDNFLIFLVSFPARLAQILYDGKEHRLQLMKPEYFPYETESEIKNCIGRPFVAVSQKGYHVTFLFRSYEDPAVSLNKVLMRK